MAKLVEGEPGFILHKRPYQEHSLLVELYTLNYGRISAVVRVSKKVGAKSAGVYQPFVPLCLSLSQGRGSLWQLKEAKLSRSAFNLKVPTLFSASYVNELLFYLVKLSDSDPRLFASYLSVLEDLEKGDDEFMSLRRFESSLIDSLGYSVSYECSDGSPISPSYCYLYNVKSGFIMDSQADEYTYRGEDLLKLREGDLSSKNARKTLKSLNKTILDALLCGKKLQSRDLYAQYLGINQ